VQWVNGDDFYEQLGTIVSREAGGTFVVQLRKGHDDERTFQGCRLDEHFVMPRTTTLEGTIDALRATVEHLIAKDSSATREQEALASSVREQRRQTLDLVGKHNKGRAERDAMKQDVYSSNLKLDTLQRQYEKAMEYQGRRDGEWRQLVMTNREQRWRMLGLEKEGLELKRQLDAEEARRMELEKVVESLNAFRDQASRMGALEAASAACGELGGTIGAALGDRLGAGLARRAQIPARAVIGRDAIDQPQVGSRVVERHPLGLPFTKPESGHPASLHSMHAKLMAWCLI
jgi:hypothetical protein